MRLSRVVAPLLLVLCVGVMSLVSWHGAFVNTDYEKIHRNPDFVLGGVLEKFLQPDAGFEHGYYRPMQNVLVSWLAHRVGTERAGPFRVASTMALGFAALTVYWAARCLGGSTVAALLCGLIFLWHPLNSWYYFQGWWIGNTLAVGITIIIWRIFDHVLRCAKDSSFWWLLTLLFLTYVGCLCKDSVALIMLMLLPVVVWSRLGSARRRWAALAAISAGVAIYGLQRAWVLAPYPVSMQPGTLFAVSHAGDELLSYGAAIVLGTTRSYARPLPDSGGWAITIALILLAGIFLYRYRDRFRQSPRVACLLWCVLVASGEIIVGSAIQYDLVASRATFLMVLLPLLGMAIFQHISSARYRRVATMLLVGWLCWCGIQSTRHVVASLDPDQFYAYHNERPYSWKLLSAWSILAYDRGDWLIAEQAARQSLALSRRPKVFINLAAILARQGRETEAMDYLTRAVRIWPGLASAHFNLGVLLAHEGRIDEAFTQLEVALRIRPDYTKARAMLEALRMRRDSLLLEQEDLLQ